MFRIIEAPSRLLHFLLTWPALLLLLALGVMLFRPPDLQFYEIDRIALIALVYFVVLRALILKHPLHLGTKINLPLLGLLLLAFFRIAAQPYDAQSWSVFAAKWVVPFVLFNVAGIIFGDHNPGRIFEIFCWVALSYLCLTAIFFLLGWKSLIFPHFILDTSIGIHADRARGPFLQAVANGVALILLGLIALDSFRRRKLPKLMAVILLLLPFAILATKTRAVWLSFAIATFALCIFSRSGRVRRLCICAVLLATVGLGVGFSLTKDSQTFSERFQESSPVEFRMALYETGWDMFLEKPLFGWSPSDIQIQLEQRIDEFHQEAFYFHNTFLEVGVAYGIVGLALYAWLLIDLVRFTRKRFPATAYGNSGNFLDAEFRALWLVILFVYVLNACFVVMNYQFVNGLVFTIAGLLAAQDRKLAGHAMAAVRVMRPASSFSV